MATKKKAASKKSAPAKPAPKKAAPKKAAAKPKAKATAKKRTKVKLAPTVSPPKGPAPDTSAPFLTQDPTAAYQHFLAAAQAVSTVGLAHLNIDPDLVVNNVGLAVAAFKPIQAAVVAAIPAAPVNRFLELPSLALALLYASDQVVGQASTGEIASRLAAVGALRTPMLDQLGVFASAPVALADPQRVKAIRAGTGPLDKAHDAVNITGYFAELGATIAGKHPFTTAQLKQLAEDGQWLLQQLSPTQAVAAPSPTDPAAVVRDQLWSLLGARYDALRAAASVVLGMADLEQHVPPLGTRLAKAKKVVAPAAPVATPAAAATVPATAPVAQAAPGK